MRKPKLNFDITKAVKDFTHKKSADFETKIILYVLEKKELKILMLKNFQENVKM